MKNSKTITDTVAKLVMSDKYEKPQQSEFARTGCLLLDLVIGGGQGLGIPYGRIVNFVGDKSSGKTFIATEVIAAEFHQKNGKLVWNYDDGESGYTFDTQALYGFEVMNDSTKKSRTVENFDTNHRRFLREMKQGHYGIYVLDSLDGVSDQDKEERAERRQKAADAGKELKEGTYDMKTPKFLSQDFFKTQTGLVAEKNSILIIISQVREDIDPRSFKKWTRSGGKALDFYAHTCLWLATVKKIVKNDRVIGVLVKAKTDKSKTPRPYRECSFVLYFDHGIDDVGSSLDFLFDLRGKDGNLLEAANEISWDNDGQAKGPKNLDNAKGFLQANQLYKNCRDARKAAENKTDLSMTWIENWVASQNEEVQTAWKNYFGNVYTRKEIVTKISSNPEMKKELDRRVIEKWERIEAEARSGLGKKYQ